VRDVVRANLLAATAASVGKGESINIGSGRQWSVNQVAAMIGGETANIEPRLELKHSLADAARAETLLGWTPEVPFEEGIAELKEMAGLGV
jgi:nucleoside-diphosphate-sugar epimerase